jgi:hypothetical protein
MVLGWGLREAFFGICFYPIIMSAGVYSVVLLEPFYGSASKRFMKTHAMWQRITNTGVTLNG